MISAHALIIRDDLANGYVTLRTNYKYQILHIVRKCVLKLLIPDMI